MFETKFGGHWLQMPPPMAAGLSWWLTFCIIL